MKVGLRFAAADAKLLRALEARVRAGDLGAQVVAVFRFAAEAAETGEPLIVECDDLDEARILAGGYTQHGVTTPVVHELTNFGAR